MRGSISISYIPAVLIATIITALLASEKAHTLSVWLIIAAWLGLTVLIWIGFQYPWGQIFNTLFNRE